MREPIFGTSSMQATRWQGGLGKFHMMERVQADFGTHVFRPAEKLTSPAARPSASTNPPSHG